MNEKNKNDAFLSAIRGVRPIKKSNRHYKLITESTINKKKRDDKPLEINPQIVKDKKEHQENKTYARFKIEKLKINKKLKRGVVNIDKRIDLHGLSVKEAKILFFETVETCFVTQKRCILFITGKGMGAAQNEHRGEKLYYGKIRNEFLSWANQKTISRKILSVEQANTTYGGDGAFFVYLRKNRN